MPAHPSAPDRTGPRSSAAAAEPLGTAPRPTTGGDSSARRPGAAGLVREVVARHGPLVAFAALMALAGLVSLGGLVLDARLLDGVSIWAKPLKFNVSLGLYALTLAWMVSVTAGPRLRRVAWWAGTVGVAAGLLEIGVITTQAVRGTRSHFNVETALDAALYGAMAWGIVFLYSATLVIGVVLLVRSRVRDRSLLWALRAGLVIGVAGLSVGFLMLPPTEEQRAEPGAGAVGAHAVGSADSTQGLPFLGWDLLNGDLRVSHFIGMHALQTLPLLALGLVLLSRGRLSEPTRVRVVWLASVAYAALTAITLWQALRGQPVVAPDGLTVGVAAGAVLMLLALGLLLLRRVREDLRESRAPDRPAGRVSLLDAPHHNEGSRGERG